LLFLKCEIRLFEDNYNIIMCFSGISNFFYFLFSLHVNEAQTNKSPFMKLCCHTLHEDPIVSYEEIEKWVNLPVIQ